MKVQIISDIHGSASLLKRTLDCERNADLLILCGDFLNHGPRNPLPEGWNTKECASLLNEQKKRVISVRGNCDSEVDQMMLTFPCLNAYTNLFFPQADTSILNGRIFIHHGHLYKRSELKELLPTGTLVISGHTHISLLEEEDGLIFFNPGSISLPKCENGRTYGLLEITPDGIKKITLISLEPNTTQPQIKSMTF